VVGTTPRVTVIIATYNWSTVLPHSIASVLEQTFDDFELLVIGDGCTDDSANVVTRIDDPRVRWHNLPANTGHQSGPNNEGIRRARGNVIAYLGHDDLWLRNHLETLVQAIDGGAGLVHASTLSVVPDRRPHRWPTAPWKYRPGECILPTTVAHRRELAETVGGWRMPIDTGELYSESDLWKRITAICGPPTWIKRVTSVKLFSAARPGVYRERPSHEQEYWLGRIRASARPAGPKFVGERWYSLSLERSAQAVRSRVAVRTRLRAHHLLPMKPALSAEERRLRDRRVKGVDDLAR